MTSTKEAQKRRCLAVVLAAGEGTRMKSAMPKVLHKVAGRSMLGHVLTALGDAAIDEVAVVVGPGREDVAREAQVFAPKAQMFVQTERLGTAHAVLTAKAALEQGFDDVLVVFADTPLVRTQTFINLKAALAEGAGVAVLGFEPADPTGYGRVVHEGDKLVSIREHKDANEAELHIGICNAGLMAIDGQQALAWLGQIGNGNVQKEFYLTDIVSVALAAHHHAVVVTAPEDEVLGVNDRVQLAAAEAICQGRLREAAMRNGATMIAPDTVFLSCDTKIGRDVIIEPNVFFGPGVSVGDGAVIHASCHFQQATIGAKAEVGPFARLRPGAMLGEGSKVGNFVEIKGADIGVGAKVSHLSYIGDAVVGAQANIGAGTITCNYDGYNKFKTEIGAGAFVGSNTSLVAPVKIGAGAYVGSGSVITKDVGDDALAVARGKQMEKAGWAARFRAGK